MTVEDFTRKGGRPSYAPSDEELARLLRDCTQTQIAIDYGVTVRTVQKWIHDARERARKNHEL